MKRSLVVTLATIVALSLSSWALAGKPPVKGSPKQSVTGTIEKVDAKQHTITVKQGTTQQVQTQAAPTQKEGKGKGSLVFQVTKTTEIVVPGAAQEAGKVNAPGQQSPGQFSLLKVGQAVRVVYTEQSAPAQKDKTKPQPAQQQDAKQKDKPQPPAPAAPAQASEQKDKPQQAEPAAPAQAVQKGLPEKGKGKTKKTLVAVRIEILGQPTGQQQSGGQAAPAK